MDSFNGQHFIKQKLLQLFQYFSVRKIGLVNGFQQLPIGVNLEYLSVVSWIIAKGSFSTECIIAGFFLIPRICWSPKPQNVVGHFWGYLSSLQHLSTERFSFPGKMNKGFKNECSSYNVINFFLAFIKIWIEKYLQKNPCLFPVYSDRKGRVF